MLTRSNSNRTPVGDHIVRLTLELATPQMLTAYKAHGALSLHTTHNLAVRILNHPPTPLIIEPLTLTTLSRRMRTLPRMPVPPSRLHNRLRARFHDGLSSV